MSQTQLHSKCQKPTGAFVGASWVSLLIGMSAYLIGLWNSNLELNEKGYYFTVLLYGLFSAISLQKNVRDRLAGITVTNIYYGISWFSLMISILLLSIGIWNSQMLASEKGFYLMAFVLSLFASITIQKNIRDLAIFPQEENSIEQENE